MGGSYGGFMTTLLLGRTDRFAAGISERGFNDPVSFVGSSDIGWFFPDEYVGTDPERIAAQSRRWRTRTGSPRPTLVIHSEEDWRCPVEQGARLYVELKRRGVPTRAAALPRRGARAVPPRAAASTGWPGSSTCCGGGARWLPTSQNSSAVGGAAGRVDGRRTRRARPESR